MKFILLASFLFSFHSSAGILPAIFYTSQNTQEDFCRERKYHNEAFWRALTKNKINELTLNRSYAAVNSYISKSYLEIFNKTPKVNGVKYMSYIYSNASHHLGRLVRYHAWPEDHPLKEIDRSFIEGAALRAINQVANAKLSTKLMHYSKDLYQELSWSLTAAGLCGVDYTLDMVKDPYLIKAYRAKTIPEFVEAFVSYEQTYLHYKMYQDLEIKIPAKITVLDNMRYMSFNGEKHPSFAEWCKKRYCGTSSYNLENRIRYDIWAILGEFKTTRAKVPTLKTRLQNAKVQETADFFISRP